ncbi:hypothetical protein CTAYLR_009580 [Chrysophaeum taylorii]|uniref:PIH1 N-terminal domain-containing protein n=1 Tax=Chrysophaeum taylorii TaxID=2483200 RepID=A0AAD7XUG9_9STRA|nr:hypothetical protein CTAYLR_009580 [Chrysophaeum taylorii]
MVRTKVRTRSRALADDAPPKEPRSVFKIAEEELSRLEPSSVAEAFGKKPPPPRPSLVEQLELPGEKVLRKDGTTRASKEASLKIVPSPGFALKTVGHKKSEFRERTEQQKYFINVCSHEAVSSPRRAKQLDDGGEEVEGVSVPVSIGPERLDTDNKGDACVVVDCVVNPSILVPDQRDFLCQLAISYVEKKYDLVLDRKFKLPRLAYKGGPCEQWIRDDSKRPKITRVEEEEDDDDDARPSTTIALGPAPVLGRVLCDDHDWNVGDEPEWPTVADVELVRVELRCACDWHAAALSFSTFAVQAKVPGRETAKYALPCGVESAAVEAIRDDAVLLSFVVEKNFARHPDPGSKPYMVARAISSPSTTTTTTRGEDVDEKPASAKYHLESRTATTTMERPPSGASAAEVAYAAARAARLAAEQAAVVAEDEVLPEDKFHEGDVISRHYIAQREANEHRNQREVDDDSNKGSSSSSDSRGRPPPSAVLASLPPLESTLWAELLD